MLRKQKSLWNSRTMLIGALIVVLLVPVYFAATPASIGAFNSAIAAADEKIGILEDINDAKIDPVERNPRAIVGKLIVKFSALSGVKNKADASAALNDISSKSAEIRNYLVLGVEPVFNTVPVSENYQKKSAIGMDRFFYVYADGADVSILIAEYKKNPLIESAEPAYTDEIAAESVSIKRKPNDEYFSMQWHHNQINDHDIDSIEAWGTEIGSENVVIAVIDLGTEYTHKDLAENMWQNLGEDADRDGHVLEYTNGVWSFDSGDMNNIDDDGNGFVDDFVGWDFTSNDNQIFGEGNDAFHGTATAGAAAATTNNDLLVAGVCWKCRIMGLRGGVAESIEYAVDNRADVISISLLSGYSDALKTVVEYAYSQDVTMVAAAGNTGQNLRNYPAAFEEVISVSATDENDAVTTFTSYGSWIDVAAPGMYIGTLDINDGGPIYASGTSMSAPLVAGIVGLMKSERSFLTNDEITTILHSAVDPVFSDRYIGTGRINAYKALLYGNVPIAKLDQSMDDLVIYRDKQKISIVGTVSGNTFKNYVLEYGRGAYPTRWITIARGSRTLTNGTIAVLNTKNLQNDLYTIRLTVYDNNHRSFIDMANVYINNDIFPTNNQVRSSPVVIDINNDGMKEIVVGSTFRVFVWNDNGILNGWPKYFPNTGFLSSPAVADIDADMEKEIIVGSDNNYLYAWNPDGSDVPGWPKQLQARIESSPAIADIDNDGANEIIVGSNDNKVYAFNHDGTPVDGWPKQTGDWVVSSPAIADIDNDGANEVIVGSFDKKVYVWNSDGTPVDGWPRELGGMIKSSPAVADLNDDGLMEIAIGARDRRIYLLKNDGNVVNGWPKEVGGNVDSSPAIANIDNDNEKEIIVGSNDNKVYAFNHDGTPVDGWPKQTGDWVVSSPAIADIDNDGANEVIVGSFDKKVYVWNSDGTPVDGWPKNAGNQYRVESSPAIADIDNDGLLEVIVGSWNVYRWEFQGSLNQNKYDWPMFRHDSFHTGSYRNNCNEATEMCGI